MKKNIKKFQKPLMCLVVMFATLFGIAVGKFMDANADEINYEYESNSIDYDNSTSNLNATNVKDAIDELYSKVGQCPRGYECFTDEEVNSSNNSHSTIISAYKYDEDSNSDSYCVTGENDEKCKKTLCYLSKSRNSCSVGTIIDYKVNDTDTVRFHVLHDDGRSMTMQAQQSQIKRLVWHEGSNDTSNGPDTILAQLESQTSDWRNVNDIEYNGNSTTFIGVEELSNTPSAMKNNNNYCAEYNSCEQNAYIYPTRKVKARMIMMQEAVDVGCTTSHSSCPKFMYNYLYDATSYGATKNDNTNGNSGYWTMSAVSSTLAWNVFRYGIVGRGNTVYADLGVRAIVVINK